MTSREQQEQLWKSDAQILSSTERIHEIIRLRWELERRQRRIQQLENSADTNLRLQLQLSRQLEVVKNSLHATDTTDYSNHFQSSKNGTGIGPGCWFA